MNSTWKRNSKGQQSHIDKLLLSFLVSMHAIYFRALRVRAVIAFKWSPRLCGYPVNSRTLETIIQQLLRLNRDSGWGKWVWRHLLTKTYPSSCDYGHVTFHDLGTKKKKLDSQTRLLTGVFSSSCHADYHFYHIEIRIFLYEIVNFAFLLRV